MEICEEMKKLREYLDCKGIEWKDASTDDGFWICRTHFKINGVRWSVINGCCTEGGIGLYFNNQGLLELMTNAVNDGEPVGFLKAQDVIGYIDNIKEE